MREIKQIHIHCSATKTDNISASTIRRWHLQRGWSDIGYHYVIELDGTIVNGRPEERAGAHAKGHNKNSIGICCIGGVDENMKPKDTRTDDQLLTMLHLLELLTKQNPNAEIIGHRDVSNKSCPSFDAKEEYSFLCK